MPLLGVGVPCNLRWGMGHSIQSMKSGTTLDARGFLREEAISGDKRREKREKWEDLWLPMTVDWSYCANRFELGSRSDPASWLEEPYSVLWLAVVLYWQVCCYWLPVNWSHDVDCHMIVRFISSATRGFLSPLLSLFSQQKKTSGTRVVWYRGQSLSQTCWAKTLSVQLQMPHPFLLKQVF